MARISQRQRAGTASGSRFDTTVYMNPHRESTVHHSVIGAGRTDRTERYSGPATIRPRGIPGRYTGQKVFSKVCLSSPFGGVEGASAGPAVESLFELRVTAGSAADRSRPDSRLSPANPSCDQPVCAIAVRPAPRHHVPAPPSSGLPATSPQIAPTVARHHNEFDRRLRQQGDEKGESRGSAPQKGRSPLARVWGVSPPDTSRIPFREGSPSWPGRGGRLSRRTRVERVYQQRARIARQSAPQQSHRPG